MSQQGVVEEQSAGTYAFSADTDGSSLSGELVVRDDFTGALTLEDGTQLSGTVFASSMTMYLNLDEGPGNINGFGWSNDDGSFGGDFQGRLNGQSANRTWSAALKSSGNSGKNPPNDSGSSAQGTLKVFVSASNAQGTVTLERVTDSGSERINNLSIRFRGGTSSSSTTLSTGDYALVLDVESDSSKSQKIPFTLDSGETETFEFDL